MTTEANNTLQLAYEEARIVVQTLYHWGDSLDTKIGVTFTISTTLMGVIPLLGLDGAPTWVGIVWLAAGFVWLLLSYFSIRGYQIRTFIVSPDPSLLEETGWLGLDRDQYLLFRLRELGRNTKVLRDVLDSKAQLLGKALRLIAIETLLLMIGVAGAVLEKGTAGAANAG